MKKFEKFSILIVGNGRLARHWVFAFTEILSKSQPQSQAPSFQITHHQNAREIEHPIEADLILALVSDSALNTVVQVIQKMNTRDALVLHASAALNIPGAVTLHPPMTFGPELYPIERYSSHPLTLIQEETASLSPEHAKKLALLLDALPNEVQVIPQALRARYHAYCVMVANFPQILWNAVFDSVENDSKSLNAAGLMPLLEQSVQNYLVHGKAALTGPLVRGDQNTLSKHLEALEGDPSLSKIYRAFIELYHPGPHPSQKEILHDYRA